MDILDTIFDALKDKIRRIIPEIISQESLILHGKGMTIKQISDAENVSEETVRRTIAKHKIKPLIWGEKCKRWNLLYIKSVIDGNWNPPRD